MVNPESRQRWIDVTFHTPERQLVGRFVTLSTLCAPSRRSSRVKSIACWVSRACASHQDTHKITRIPMLVARDGDPCETRACPLILYYEQLLKDPKHVLSTCLEPVERTILESIPRTVSAPLQSMNSPSSISSSSSTEPDHEVWHQKRRSRGKKKTQTADTYIQEVVKNVIYLFIDVHNETRTLGPHIWPINTYMLASYHYTKC